MSPFYLIGTVNFRRLLSGNHVGWANFMLFVSLPNRPIRIRTYLVQFQETHYLTFLNPYELFFCVEFCFPVTVRTNKMKIDGATKKGGGGSATLN